MLAIFDIDGTVVDTQSAEGDCYVQAIVEVTGSPLRTLDWSQYQNATSSGIFREAVGERDDIEVLEQRFSNRYLELLREARLRFPQDFLAIEGAAAFIESLSSMHGVEVAFATGAYYSEAAFKLECGGIELDAYPHATSSDSPVRQDIIQLAADRAGHSFSSVVYFGDGMWDVAATQSLGIPMVGIGRGIKRLEERGVPYSFRDYTNPEAILESMERLVSRG